MDDFAPLAVSTAGLTEARWKTGELYVYHHRIRCPGCARVWRLDLVAPRGAIDPSPDPAKIIWGLLCGECSARRGAAALIRRGDGKIVIGRYWTDEDYRRIYGVCLNHRGKVVEITRGEAWDGVTPLVDERRQEEDRILCVDGRKNPAIGPQRLAALGLDWVATEGGER